MTIHKRLSVGNVGKRLFLATSLAAMTALSGCYEPTAPTDTLTQETASRFLHQATFGATQADIDHLMAVGYEAWMTEQFAEAPSDSYWEYVDRRGPPACTLCNSQPLDAVQEAFWYQVVEGKAQLRQRVAFALAELFVVSGTANSTLYEQELSIAAFQQMLQDNSFSNFRVLLEKVSLHPAMGVFLSHRQNDKEDPTTGRLPDENFARELMQLFTIGKWQLYNDGTRMKDANGNDIPTYTQADIMGMAKVFTGWSWGGDDKSENRWQGFSIGAEDTRTWNLQMQPYYNHASTSEKAILNGVVIPANTSPEQSVQIALDTLFNHQNTAPFVATHLIKRLVTSNPSPAYVARVANVFLHNDKGERGDMKAVVRAVLFDPEARDVTKLNEPTWGKLREPVIRLANYFRAFNVRSPSRVYYLGPLNTTPYDVAQTPWMAPSVFNFFMPDHMPPGEIANNGLTAPEFQILDEATAPGYANFMQRGIENYFGYFQTNEYKPDYSKEVAVAGDAAALVTRLALMLNGGYVSAESRAQMESAINSINGTTADGKLRRVRTAIVLMLASPDYLIQK
jgi:uncharacterized protein (DUF1800 family)